MALVTLDEAKRHLRIQAGDSDHDDDVALKIDQAGAIVIDYLKAQGNPAWTESTAPGPVRAATFLMLGHLYQNRGDDQSSDESLWQAIRRLLERLRDPALA